MGIFPDAQGQLAPQSLDGSDRNSNSVDTLWLSSLSARMEKIRSKMKALEWPQCICRFFRRSRAEYSICNSGIWKKFKLIQALMHVLFPAEMKKIQLKIKVLEWLSSLSARMEKIRSKMKALEWPQCICRFFRRSRAEYSICNSGIWKKFKLIQALMHVLFPAEMKKIQLKIKVLDRPQHISHCKSMGIFPDAKGQLTPHSFVGSGRNSNSVDTL